MRAKIFKEIENERIMQDSAHGGHTNDDQHTPNDWCAILVRHLGLACNDEGIHEAERYRRQMIRVAAVAVAAIESFDRKHPKSLNLLERGPGY